MKKVKISQKPDSEHLTCSKDFGKAVQYRRTSLGLTRQLAANLCNINERTMDKIEKGNEAVGLNNALKVANALGIEIQFTIKGNSDEL